MNLFTVLGIGTSVALGIAIFSAVVLHFLLNPLESRRQKWVAEATKVKGGQPRPA